MKIMSLLAHPRPSSFCHAISARACETLRASGHEVLHHDLYAEGFDPCLTAEESYTTGDTWLEAATRTDDPVVTAHRREIACADGLLVVHPNWWGKPPAIMAGWLDRVLIPGVAYRLSTADGLPQGMLSFDTAVVINTSDTPAARELEAFGDPLDAIWGRCVLPFCGVQGFRRQVFRPVVDSTQDQRAAWLDDVAGLVREVWSASPR